MTGFTKWLRKICLLAPQQSSWVEGREDEECTPARMKLSIRNRQQFEIKIEYLLDPQLRKQKYKIEVYVFFTKELETANLNFYDHLWSSVKLHTPKALLSDLSSLEPGTQLNALSNELEALLRHTLEPPKAAKEDELPTRIASVKQLLRLFCESVRRSIRPEAKALHAQLKAARKEGASAPTASDLFCLQTNLLVQSLTAVIDVLQEVCSVCELGSMPAAVCETWALCKEFLLCEADRCLMKLLFAFERLGQSPHTPKEDCVIDIEMPVKRRPEQIRTSLTAPLGSRLTLGLSGAGHTLAQHHSLWVGGGSPDGFGAPRRSLLPPEAWDRIHRCLSAGFPNEVGPASGEEGQGQQETPDALTDPVEETKAVLTLAIDKLQEARQEAGFNESIIRNDSQTSNELYTHRLKALKGGVQGAVSLNLQHQQLSTLLADIAGMTFAGFAMGVTLLFFWIADHYGGSKYGIWYLLLIVGSYMLKDRIKEWGKRYLKPMAEWFGFHFPDKITNLVDSTGQAVGQSRQKFAIKSDTEVDARVLEMRWKNSAARLQRQATTSERVMVYSKRMHVHWTRVNKWLQAVTGMDDIMRLDLQHLCRRMSPSSEDHYRLSHGKDGSSNRVEKVACARVYHLNMVFCIKSSQQHEATAKDSGGRLMRLESARLVVNREGILRLESLGSVPLHKLKGSP